MSQEQSKTMSSEDEFWTSIADHIEIVLGAHPDVDPVKSILGVVTYHLSIRDAHRDRLIEARARLQAVDTIMNNSGDITTLEDMTNILVGYKVGTEAEIKRLEES